MKLAYEAINTSGTAVNDVLEAASVDEAISILRNKGLFVTDISPDADGVAAPKAVSKSQGEGGGLSLKGRTHRLKLVAMFSRQFYVLVATGTPLADGLAAMERQIKDLEFRTVIGTVREQVEHGLTLSEAFSRAPRYFDEVYCNIIKAGESSGSLPTMLDRLALLSRKQAQVRSQLSGAMVYPCLLIVISIAVLVIMLTLVLPRFSGLFDSLDVPLPATTEALVWVSGLLRRYWWAFLLAFIASAFGLRHWAATPAGKQAIDGMMISFPKIRDVTRSYATARIARLLGVLIECNVPLLESLQLARNSTGNSRYSSLMAKAEQTVINGELVSSAFSDDRMIDSSFYEALRNGEQSGKLGLLMVTVADFLDEENDVRLRALTSLIEPLILVFLGVMVGGIAVSMFMPLFDLTSMAGGGG